MTTQPTLRPEQPGDIEKVEQIINLLTHLLEFNPQYEVVHWVGAFFSCIAYSYIESGLTHELFREEILRLADSYKKKFEFFQKENE